MAGKLDEISRCVGALEANTGQLQATFKQHCIDDDNRHRENVGKMQEISAEIRDLSDIVKPLLTVVEAMRPIVGSYQASRWRKAGAISVLVGLLSLVGWIIEILIGKGIAFLFSR